MIKRGVLLISILILIFNISYVDGAFEGGCNACNFDIDCNPEDENGLPPFEFICAHNDNCGGGELKCEGSTTESGAWGTTTYQGNCYSSGNSNNCYRVASFDEEGPNVCSNEYSCNGNELTISYRDRSYTQQNGWQCNDISSVTYNCGDLDMCSEYDARYGETCYCDADLKACVTPTNFLEIKEVSGIDCEDDAHTESGYVAFLDGYYSTFGLDWYSGNYDWWDEEVIGGNWIPIDPHTPHFFRWINSGRIWWQLDEEIWESEYVARLDCEDEQEVILDLGEVFSIYAIKVYGEKDGEHGLIIPNYLENLKFELYYSENGNDWVEIYNGVMGYEPNLESFEGDRVTDGDTIWPPGNFLFSEEYWGIEYNENPNEDEFHLDYPVGARYLKYVSTWASEIVIEGKPCLVEGINHEDTCNDNFDNDCDGDVDEQDEGCDPFVNDEFGDLVLRLDVLNPGTLCNGDSGSYRTSLAKVSGSIDMESVIVYDEIYNSNDELENINVIDCVDNMLNDNLCSERYDLSLGIGNYYHNIYAEADGNERVRRDNYKSFVVYDIDSDECCVDEGSIPGDGEVCCYDMPTDGVGGRCGCPSDFDWDPIEGICEPAGQVCWSSDEGEREEYNLECVFEWFTQSWWDDAFNEDLVDCFRTEDEIITQACCNYMDYDGKEYGEYQSIEVYKT